MRNFFLSALFVLFAGYSTQANLLTNGSFEAGFETNIPGWTLTDADHIAVAPSARYLGSNGIVMKGWTSGGRIYQDIPAAGVSNYTFRAFGMWSNGFSSNYVVQMSLEFFSAEATQLQASAKRVSRDAPWYHYSITAPSPSNTAVVRVALSFLGPSGTNGGVNWDQLYLASAPFMPPTYYVCPASPYATPVFPYTGWDEAATNIQDALDVASDGSVIRVRAGLYQITSSIRITNAVTVYCVDWNANATVDGQGLTRCFEIENSNAVVEKFVIKGGFADQGAGGLCRGGTLRNCVIAGNRAVGQGVGDGGGGLWLLGGSTLDSCIVSKNSSAGMGGGIQAESGVVISNCTLTGNVASNDGGGLYASGTATVENCVFGDNRTARDGGGICWSGSAETHAGGLMKACRILGNVALNDGGGAYVAGAVEVDRCVLSDNKADRHGGGVYAHSSKFRNGLLFKNTSGGRGGGAFLTAGSLESCTIVENRADLHGGLSVCSSALVLNCIVYDNTAAIGSANWGASDSDPDPATFSYTCSMPLMPGVGNIDVNPGLRPDYAPSWNSPCVNAGLGQAWMTQAMDLRDSPRLRLDLVDMGAYEIGKLRYVSPSGSHEAPFLTWATAATNIQSAVDVAEAWDNVLVTNGVYRTGTRVAPGGIFVFLPSHAGTVVIDHPYMQTNRVFTEQPVYIQSVNGPSVTIVDGDGTARCAYLGVGSELIGFTLRHGWVDYFGYRSGSDLTGAGAYLSERSAMLDCIVESNTCNNTSGSGGAACYDGSLIERCVFRSNRGAVGGNVFCVGGILRNCLLIEGQSTGSGGGIYSTGGTIQECTIESNRAAYDGGGVFCSGGIVERCRIMNNTASEGGNVSLWYGGVLRDCLLTKGVGRRSAGGLVCYSGGDVQNCTITDNRSQWESSAGVKAYSWDSAVRFQNCIVCNNYFGTNDQNLVEWNWAQSGTNPVTWSSSCTTPNPGGSGNITNGPLFMDPAREDYRLKHGSPCIDAGVFWTGMTTDVAGAPRPLDGDLDGLAQPDIGAYEYDPQQTDSDGDRLSDYDELATHATNPDANDSDEDGMGDGDEIQAGCLPNDSSSLLVIRHAAEDVLLNTEQGFPLRWPSIAGRRYNVLRASDLTEGFSLLQSNIEATPPENIYLDAAALQGDCFFYQIELAP